MTDDDRLALLRELFSQETDEAMRIKHELDKALDRVTEASRSVRSELFARELRKESGEGPRQGASH